MDGALSRALLRLTASKRPRSEPSPLLIELLEPESGRPSISYESYPFEYAVVITKSGQAYSIASAVPLPLLPALRRAVKDASDTLDPESVDPLTFNKLVEVLRQLGAESLAQSTAGENVLELSELVAYEAIGLSRVLALAKDQHVNEFYVDSDVSPVYLDHAQAGRCDTKIQLTQRERDALVTHIDTFRGYTLDYATPSLKNDLEIAGARLRISIDLDPVSVNRFALDVRRLNIASLTLRQLTSMNVISSEASAFLLAWLELSGNVTIIGETGTGKTTLLNALDEELNPHLRRVYIEDAVETKDLLDKGFHQMKVHVDPFERGGGRSRTKESEIIKALHRSPDLLILSEIQSEEHSRAFFHALSAGARGLQTFHASTVEQAVRRWTEIHGIPKQSLLGLGLLVQMSRPDRLKPLRRVSRVCQLGGEGSEVRIRDVFRRDRAEALTRVIDWDRVNPPEGHSMMELMRGLEGKTQSSART